MSDIERRRISDHDAQVLGGVTSSVIKAGVAAAALVAAGPVAAIGVTLAQELTGVILEGQKERLTGFAKRFTSRTAELPADAQDRIREQLQTEEGSRIFETAWNQAAKVVDPEKLDYLSALLTNSLSSKELQEHQTRWLLRLLDEIDIVEIIILQSYTATNLRNEDFHTKHATVFAHSKAPERQYRRAYNDWGFLGQQEIPEQPNEETQKIKERLQQAEEEYQIARELHALFQSRTHHLIELGLLGIGHSNYKTSNALTPLGAALLKIIDLALFEEWGSGEQTNAVEAIHRAEMESEASRKSAARSVAEAQKQGEKNLRDFSNRMKEGFERAARKNRGFGR